MVVLLVQTKRAGPGVIPAFRPFWAKFTPAVRLKGRMGDVDDGWQLPPTESPEAPRSPEDAAWPIPDDLRWMIEQRAALERYERDLERLWRGEGE